jgi:hypothetical protein
MNISEDIAKKVAELLTDETERIRLVENERYEKEVLSEAYETIRCAHIDDALVREDIEETFSLIYTPGKY